MPLSKIKFGNTYIGTGYPCFIIAEIGINHEGCIDTCVKMVKAAANAGADAIKLQTSDPDENYHPDTYSYEIYKKSFIGIEGTSKIFNYARTLGLEVFTTSGLRTLEWVDKLKPSGYKISSGLFSNFLLMEETIKKGRPIILSTGLSTYSDVDNMVDLFKKHNFDEYMILQCTSLYPCPEEHINLSSIETISNRYNVISGLSDHSTSTDVPAFAVAAGAKIIEKHFTLDTSRSSFDHFISLDEKGFRDMVNAIRRSEVLMGNGRKELLESVSIKRNDMGRFIFSSENLTTGHIITIDDVIFLRASSGNKSSLVSAANYKDIVGKTLKQDLNKLEPITVNDVKN